MVLRTVKKLLPYKYKVAAVYLAIRLQGMLDTADVVQCNICHKKGRTFKSFNGRAGALCPSCFSLERHRMLYDFFERTTPIFTDALSVLHFAPEKPLWSRFKQNKKLNYTTADLMVHFIPLIGVHPDRMMSVTDIEFPSESFDWVICNHVLEHVPDDKKAMSEIFRVLRPGGKAVLLVPIRPDGQETLEDSQLNREQRRTLYGSPDHVRYYGEADYLSRLRSVGFDAKVVDYAASLPEDVQTKIGVRSFEHIYLAERPSVAHTS